MTTARKSHNQILSEFFKSHPGQWIDGKDLERIAGGYAWRTRVSNIRRPPFSMVIENRIRTVEVPTDDDSRRKYLVSEYRYVPQTESVSIQVLHIEAEGDEAVSAAIEAFSTLAQQQGLFE